MNYRSFALPSFWHLYDQLPPEIQRAADRQYERFCVNPTHPSLQLKPAGAYWSARVTLSYRALARRRGNVFIWFWIGSHEAYEELLRQRR